MAKSYAFMRAKMKCRKTVLKSLRKGEKGDLLAKPPENLLLTASFGMLETVGNAFSPNRINLAQSPPEMDFVGRL